MTNTDPRHRGDCERDTWAGDCPCNAAQQVKDVALCATCGVVSLDVWMLHCPRDGAVMGESAWTREQIEQAAALGRLV